MKLSPLRETFFKEFLHFSLPNNVMLEQTVSGVYLTTIHRYENRRVSRFLAQTKREAIRRFRFELENLLDYWKGLFFFAIFSRETSE